MVFKLKYIAPHCGGIKRGRRPPRPVPSPPPLAAARGRRGAALGAAQRAGAGAGAASRALLPPRGGAILESQWQGRGTCV